MGRYVLEGVELKIENEEKSPIPHSVFKLWKVESSHDGDLLFNCHLEGRG